MVSFINHHLMQQTKGFFFFFGRKQQTNMIFIGKVWQMMYLETVIKVISVVEIIIG